MRKKIIPLLIVLLFGFVLADNITNYQVLSDVPLGTNLTISGKFLDDLNINTNIWCDYYALNSQGEKIYRLSSTKTDLKGNFFASLTINEPIFKRGNDYNALTICDQAEMKGQFTVSQRETIFNPLLFEFKWIFESENLFPILIVSVFILVIVFFHYSSHIYFYFENRK